MREFIDTCILNKIRGFQNKVVFLQNTTFHLALKPYRDKIISVEAVTEMIRPGQHVLIDAGCAVSRSLVMAPDNLDDHAL